MYVLFFTLYPTLTIQNKYFGTLIPDLFSQIFDTKFNWQKLTDEELSSLLISFVQNIGDTMIIGFRLVICYFHVTLEVLKHFTGLSVSNSFDSRFLCSNMEDSIPSKPYKISG